MLNRILPLAMLAAAAPSLATIPESGGLYAAAIARQGDTVDQRTSDLQFVEFDVADQFASVSTTVNDDPQRSTGSYAQVVASWLSPESGSAELNWGWLSRNGGSGTPTTVSVSTLWHYGFSAGFDGWFSGDYAVSLLGGDGIGIDAVLLGGDWGDIRIQSGADSFRVPLVIGRRYDFILFASGLREGSDGLHAGADAQALLNWRITGPPGAVPEPAGWALLILGFGMAGAVQRRRRRAVA